MCEPDESRPARRCQEARQTLMVQNRFVYIGEV
jgi:hypothetical protein